ncbi:MAG: hypothetical protein APF84_10235 [Gracilibacter sp. BRH_c7a]|nr:MAG: hypothetical protein APF84_10235 [Gracilibacter sp. BRH_c7a]
MANQWVALITGYDFIVARVVVSKNKEMKIHFLDKYPGQIPMTIEIDEVEKKELNKLKKWLKELDIPLHTLKIALPSLGLITKVVDLPQMSNYDLEDLITNQIQEYFTIEISNYLIDYRILNKYLENDKSMIKVLLAALPMERIEYILALCQQLGFEPSVIDLTADCISRIYGHLSSKRSLDEVIVGEEESSTGDMAIVSLHADKVEFVLLRAGQFFLYSDMEIDIRNMLERYDNSLKETKDLLVYIGEEESEESQDESIDLSAYIIEEEPQDIQNPQEPQKTHEPYEPLQINNFELLTHIDDEELVLSQPSNKDIESSLEGGFFYPQEVYLEGIDGNMLWEIEEQSNNLYTETDNNQLEDTIKISGNEFSVVQEQDEDSQRYDWEQQTELNMFKQAALKIEDQDEAENEFLLEDLFVPLEKLNNDLETGSLEDFRQWEDDLDKTLIGIEDRDSDRGSEELEISFRPVLNTLSGLLGSFESENLGHTVREIYLTGEYSRNPYLTQFFQENLGIVAVTELPNGWQPQIAKEAKDQTQDWQKYACLLGLALRED